MSGHGELTAAQRAIVEGLSQNRCVTSGAGCGKTRVLVERYIQFLREMPDLGLERLAAITFTENAAAEMRDRIRAACRARVHEARAKGNAAEVQRWLQRYWDVDVAPINTIHGFCASLLRQYPIEAGVDPNFAVLDDASAALLANETAGAVIERLLEADDPDVALVLEHFDLPELQDTLAEMLRHEREALQRVAAPVLAQSDEEVLAGLRKALAERTRRACREALANPALDAAVGTVGESRGPGGDRIEQTRAAVAEALDRLRGARTAEIAARAIADIAGADLRGGSARAWPSKDAFEAVKDSLKAVRDALRKIRDDVPAFDGEAEARHLAVVRALDRTAGRAIADYDAAKRAASSLDFEDLQMRARDLLRRDGRVLKALRKRYRAVLVDELQDTNFLQFEIVDLLVSEPSRRGTVLRPGALFAVGDPKQSIYRFRGAQVEVFQAALDRVGPDARKDLSESWRLHPGTAALVNTLFETLLAPAYEPIEGKRPCVNEAVGEILIVADPKRPEGLRSDEGHAEEARAIAARLQDIVENHAVFVYDDPTKARRPARYGDVAVLFRRMSFLHLYEEALERQGVPYTVVAGGGFYTQPEVLDVLGLLRVLEDPGDNLRLAGVLRSPFFAVSDEGLYRLRASGRPLAEAVGRASDVAGLEDADRRGLERAARLLAEWAPAKDRLGLGALVDRVVFQSGYAASAVGRFGGARAYGNLRQMADLARAFEARGLHGLGDYIEYVTDFMGSEMRQEQAALEEAGADAVRLMTIHKAKGLEFPVVVVPDLGFLERRTTARWVIHDATGLALGLREAGDGRPASAAMALARLDAAEADEAEGRRLLYVVTTRAKDYLMFASHIGYKRGSGDTWHDLVLRGLVADAAEGRRKISLRGEFLVHLTVMAPPRDHAARQKRRVGPRDIFQNGRVAWRRLGERREAAPARRIAEVLQAFAPPPPVLHLPPRLTATALNAYDRCPALYWWGNVVGLEFVEPAESPAAGALDPRQVGRVLHRAMELARSPDEADVQAAAGGAVRELAAAPDEVRQALRPKVAAAVRAFWASDLGRRAAHARRVHRELPLLLAVGGTEIAAAVDLLFENAEGQWELVDYKSGSPDAGRAPEAASAYGLQLGLYALAAGRWLGRPPARWSVYFLGSAVAFAYNLSAEDVSKAQADVERALAGLAAGDFEPRRGRTCPVCPFRAVCGG